MSAIGSLLKLLSPAAPGPAGLPPERVEGADFATLLTQARAGEVASGLPVKNAARGLELSEDQLRRLALAADRAEAQGATRALVLIDGLTLKLDITMREITGSADLKSGNILTGIDAVINMQSPGAEPPQVLPLPRNSAGLGNASLLKLLAEQERQQPPAA
jgi:hypothetical protein